MLPDCAPFVGSKVARAEEEDEVVVGQEVRLLAKGERLGRGEGAPRSCCLDAQSWSRHGFCVQTVRARESSVDSEVRLRELRGDCNAGGNTNEL